MLRSEAKIGDIVMVGGCNGKVTYRIIKTMKTVCWVQVLTGIDGQTYEDGKVYKGTKYGLLEKVSPIEKVSPPPVELPFKVGDIVTSIKNPILYQVKEITLLSVGLASGEGTYPHTVSRSEAAALLRKVHKYIVAPTGDQYALDEHGVKKLLIAQNEVMTPKLLLQLAATGDDYFYLCHYRADTVDLVNEGGRVKIVVKP